uniref:L1 transposable element RRM domain-containing protein n=1 Tax=Salarias fasciatus TaxID=181472 RepID=A0A672FKB6_SALFA
GRRGKQRGRNRSEQKTTKVKQQEETMAEPVTAAVLEEMLKRFFNEAEKKSEEKFERLQNQLSTIQSTLSKHAEDIENQRSQIAVIETRVQTNEETLPKLGDALAQVEKKLVALEDMNRRDNLRIMNIKEGEEKGSMLAYLTNSLPKWFPGLARSPPELMRAHRLGPPRQSTSPRTIIEKCLRFTDRDRTLNEFRKTPVLVCGQQIKLAADYSDTTARERRPCYPVMNPARTLGFQVFLLYPSVIKLINAGESKIDLLRVWVLQHEPNVITLSETYFNALCALKTNSSAGPDGFLKWLHMC